MMNTQQQGQAARVPLSKGHEFQFRNSVEGMDVEVYRGPAGDWFSAPLHNVIDVHSGYRIGRWLGPARLSCQEVRLYLGLSQEEKES